MGKSAFKLVAVSVASGVLVFLITERLRKNRRADGPPGVMA